MSSNQNMIKKMVLGGIAAFVFVSLYDFLVHGFLMKGLYDSTQSVWRPQEESSMAVMILSQFLFSMALAFFYPIVGPDKDCKKAIPFGFGLGLVMGMPQIASYSYLPIPISISLFWALATFIQVLGCTLIISKIFNKL